MSAMAKSTLLKRLAVASLPLWSLSGWAAEPAATDAPRLLLQPPRESIASPITDRFALRGSVSHSSIDSVIRKDPLPLVQGTTLSGEDTLGMDDARVQASLELMFRLTPRHRIRADFHQIKRTGDATLDELVLFGGQIYRINDRVVSDMDMRTLGLTYTYSVLKKERFELGFGFALHLLQAEGESRVPARLVRESFDVAGPFATLATDATWRMTNRFSLNARAQYLSGNVDAIDGSFADYHADMQFRVRPNLALGLGYSQQRYRIDSLDPSFAGRFVLKVGGPEAFVRVSY